MAFLLRTTITHLVTSEEPVKTGDSLEIPTSLFPLDYYLHNSSFLNPPRGGDAKLFFKH